MDILEIMGIPVQANYHYVIFELDKYKIMWKRMIS